MHTRRLKMASPRGPILLVLLPLFVVFQALGLPHALVLMMIDRLRSEDMYSQIPSYPMPEHRSTALATQAKMLYVLLYFAPEVLEEQHHTMREIVDVHFPDIKKNLLSDAMDLFFDVRDVPGIKKKPSTSELLDWLKLLLAEDIPAEALHSDNARDALPPLHGALLKNEQDVHLFERLAFMTRR